ncbi:MAG TPA: hypothetical protein PK440_21615 [Candidatus Accumulibacter phosphatis]|nr:MAG: hypothetical protein AW07_01870 [Candidatus Accumulibacter sp. SK-11]HRL74628.1 hypothetical protein [Candidatus Accumulibacter phosphatis]HRQ97551.1 hypothetical protein [Candidatus Accumulibacter phosphatis]
MIEEVAAYGAVVVAIAYLSRGLFAASLLPALTRRWPMLLRRRELAASSDADRPASVSPCSRCSGCAAGQRTRPHSKMLIVSSRGTKER